MATSNSPRRFAPLKTGSSSDAPKLQGIVFDMDGTLCEPQNYMFGEMRAALGITKAVDIIDHMNSLPEAEQPAAHAAVQAIERTAMAEQAPQPGLDVLMRYLDDRGVQKAICTRNFNVPVDHLLGKFLAYTTFAPIVTRDFSPPKPSPAGILHIAEQWALRRQGEGGHADATGLIMVGDSVDDMTAGRTAGAATVLLVNDVNRELAEHAHTDLVISRLDELVDILENGFQGRSID
ncbi:HAD superfamily hydrolase, putative [Cordyceps militaris CM01]|uniref:HAD superfamily hydrolase, putative n=1 Tax=Cordyceps militaris (strain CM01) TaxID=983644 RepID=G3JKB5_CORMM|nr:HAD superfamily hydrolase, putative [Cordyceps militaris CM01]EGX91399.1 HAD superfamily hydrolase, putative [Cordyceps militaris CM01]